MAAGEEPGRTQGEDLKGLYLRPAPAGSEGGVIMIYKMDFGKGKLTPIETESKSALTKGTILQLNGYDNPRYVIVKNGEG